MKSGGFQKPLPGGKRGCRQGGQGRRFLEKSSLGSQAQVRDGSCRTAKKQQAKLTQLQSTHVWARGWRCV